MKMVVFWDDSPCSLVEIDQRFRGSYCLHHQDDETLMIEIVSTFEMSVNSYQIARRNIPEDSHIYTRRLENLKSHQQRT
jgi:hypothetical protein